MEERQSKPKHLLEPLLQGVDSSTFFIRHLLVYIVLSEGKYRNKVGAVLDSNLDEPEPPSQSKICGTRTCAQTLSCATHDDGDCLSWPTFQDVGARPLGNTANAEGHKDFPVHGNIEIVGESEKVRPDARESRRESGGFSRKGSNSTHSNYSMWVIPKYVWAIWGKITFFQE